MRVIVLVLIISSPACGRTASLGIIAADCACGEVWRAALSRERLTWEVERARLESELAALRIESDSWSLSREGVSSKLAHGVNVTKRRAVNPAQSPTPRMGATGTLR